MRFQEQIVIPVGPLQLVFSWYHDRYGHRVERAGTSRPEGAPARCFLESMEGLSSPIWPDSPPLQECHVEQRSDGQTVALLVGRAGTSHWSLSVLCDPAAGSLLFEAACRLRGEPAWLGSRYLAAFRTEEPGDAQLVLDVPGRGQSWSLHSWVLARGTKPAQRISIAAPPIGGADARTVQWSYVARLANET